MKICRACERDLPLDAFYKHPTDRHGVSGICKECQKAANKKRYRKKRAFMEANGLVKPKPYPAWVVKHGHNRMENISPEYHSWRSMIGRCLNPKSADYRWYGAMGVTICERWREDFRNFLADMGPRPKGTTLDRIDPFGNYEPGNCRWATHMEQAHNKRTSRKRAS